MAGFPPNAEGQVTLANWRKAPFNKWSFTHLRELIPSAVIANDPNDVAELSSAPVDLGGLEIELDGARYDLAGFLAETDTDGMIVLREGRVVLEHYGSGMGAATPHFLASVTKSVLGLVAGVLAGHGVLATDRPVTDWIPEVAETAWAGATLRDLLDMRAGILFDEDYLATSGAIIEYRKAQGWDPLAPRRGALGPSNLVPEPHRVGRPARRGVPLRLAQHRSSRMGDRAGRRAALHRSRERASVAADGGDRRCVHHR